MPLSIFSLPKVQNWALNVQNGKDEYFWDEAIYSFTRIYRSFSPLMRFCVDMLIEGKKPSEIAQITKIPINTIYDTIKKAKKRLKKAVLKQIKV